ncbi:hypothetical protein BJY24_005354 [Nocardia transvalensis]|uniref:PepSY domain-containing protein n=1 Tax=Nocardia transvalensis TaxID=37333 RepID=A0A7W9UKM0_9NOCA|nr:PepSY domain-containing protein [Nocardia transvalensis]MBB5916442.1 hypothetical protein [Nocardia transvalensis]
MTLVARRILGGLRWMLVGAVAVALIGGGLVLASFGSPGRAHAGHSLTQVAKTTITKDQATAKALEAVPGATVLSAELDTDAGVTTWEVDVRGTDGVESEVRIDAESGAVVGTDREGV